MPRTCQEPAGNFFEETSMTTFTLPAISKPQNQCGDCQECCIAFHLGPEASFWEEMKRPTEPCRYLSPHGCTIHDQRRPKYCEEFKCLYLEAHLKENWRPNKSKIIIRVSPFGMLTETLGVGGCEVELVECEEKALLKLDASKVRYEISKGKVDGGLVLVIPYGCSIPIGQVRVYDNFCVYWHDNTDYAAKLWNWWNG